MYCNNLKEVYKTITNLYGMNNVHLDDGKTGIFDMCETAPFIKDDVFVTKGLILIQCISCDRDMSWQPLTASKHSQVVQAAFNAHLSSGGSDVRKMNAKQFTNFGEFSRDIVDYIQRHAKGALE